MSSCVKLGVENDGLISSMAEQKDARSPTCLEVGAIGLFSGGFTMYLAAWGAMEKTKDSSPGEAAMMTVPLTFLAVAEVAKDAVVFTAALIMQNPGLGIYAGVDFVTTLVGLQMGLKRGR